MKPLKIRIEEAPILQLIREGYNPLAKTSGCCCLPGTACCGPTVAELSALARRFGYSQADLDALPPEANLGLSCGNPIALAALQPGEVVLDLGCGGGFDLFIAARKIGSHGRALGVDMAPDMVGKARRNVDYYRQRTGCDHIELRREAMEYLPVADASVDVVISNCAIHMALDKGRVWREIARVLRPGGRAAIVDLALLRLIPVTKAAMTDALTTVGGRAVTVAENEQCAREAGFSGLKLTLRPDCMTAFIDHWPDSLYHEFTDLLPSGGKPEDYLIALEVQARKP